MELPINHKKEILTSRGKNREQNTPLQGAYFPKFLQLCRFRGPMSHPWIKVKFAVEEPKIRPLSLSISTRRLHALWTACCPVRNAAGKSARQQCTVEVQRSQHDRRQDICSIISHVTTLLNYLMRSGSKYSCDSILSKFDTRSLAITQKHWIINRMQNKPNTVTFSSTSWKCWQT